MVSYYIQKPNRTVRLVLYLYLPEIVFQSIIIFYYKNRMDFGNMFV